MKICGICYKPLVSENTQALPCMHRMCKDCAAKEFKMRSVCPWCKMEMPPEFIALCKLHAIANDFLEKVEWSEPDSSDSDYVPTPDYIHPDYVPTAFLLSFDCKKCGGRKASRAAKCKEPCVGGFALVV